MNALRAATVAEIRSALPTEAHRLLFDHFAVLSDVSRSPLHFVPHPAEPNVDAQRLASNRAAFDARRERLEKTLGAKAGTSWEPLLSRVDALASTYAEIEDATGIECGDDLALWIGEIAALCKRGRTHGPGQAAFEERKTEAEKPTVPPYDPWNLHFTDPWTLGISPTRVGDLLLSLSSGEDPERIAEAASIVAPIVRKVGNLYAEFLGVLRQHPEEERPALVSAWAGDWDSRHLATVPGPNEYDGHPPVSRCVLPEIKGDVSKSIPVPKGSPLTPWNLDCTPDQAQLACRLWANGKRLIEVAASADVSKHTADKIRLSFKDLIEGLRTKPESEWPLILAKRVVRWKARVELRDTEGASAN